jgi:hypothetical protein
VPYSDQYSNVTAGIAVIEAKIPTSIIRTTQDMNDLQNGNIYAMIDRQNASVSAQLAGMTEQANFLSDQIYNPQFGWKANYSAFYTHVYGTNGNESYHNETDGILGQAEQSSRSETGLWLILFVVAALVCISLLCAIFVIRYSSRSPRHEMPAPITSGVSSSYAKAHEELGKRFLDKK